MFICIRMGLKGCEKETMSGGKRHCGRLGIKQVKRVQTCTLSVQGDGWKESGRRIYKNKFLSENANPIVFMLTLKRKPARHSL